MALPEICVAETTCPNEWPSILLNQETAQTVSVVLKDREGTPITINTATHDVVLKVKEMVDSEDDYLSLTCTIGTGGSVSFSVTDSLTQVQYPGTWIGEFIVSLKVGGSKIGRYRTYLDIFPNLTEYPQYNPLTIAEVRMAIRDRCAEDNFFLDKVEFSNTEIVFAIRRPIDYWNDTPPFIANYTPVTFPWRYMWLDATIGELLRMAALNLTRNRAPVQTGGIATDDKVRADAYHKLGDMFQERWENWVAKKKFEQNINSGWGYTQLHAARGSRVFTE